jgi:hypothetical protein
MQHALVAIFIAFFALFSPCVSAEANKDGEWVISTPLSNVTSHPREGSSIETQCVMGGKG